MTLADSPISSPDIGYNSSDIDSFHQWDINDNLLPTILEVEPYNSWPNGHSKAVYCEDNSEEARRHASGWAMRNTNNHKVEILKKSCLGVLVCSENCTSGQGVVRMRPAICDKARRKQLGKRCPMQPRCSGRLQLRPCRGHSGYPVTHFWRHLHGKVFFQAKGIHDHPAPDLKTTVDGRRSNPRSPGHYERQRGVTRKRVASSRDIYQNSKLPHLDYSVPTIVQKQCGCRFACDCTVPNVTFAQAYSPAARYVHDARNASAYIQIDELALQDANGPTVRLPFSGVYAAAVAYSPTGSSHCSSVTASPAPGERFDLNAGFKAACDEFTAGFAADSDDDIAEQTTTPTTTTTTTHVAAYPGGDRRHALPACMFSCLGAQTQHASLIEARAYLDRHDSTFRSATSAGAGAVADVDFLSGEFDVSSGCFDDDQLSLNLPAITAFLEEDSECTQAKDVDEWSLGGDETTPRQEEEEEEEETLERASQGQCSYSALLQASDGELVAEKPSFCVVDFRELLPSFS